MKYEKIIVKSIDNLPIEFNSNRTTYITAPTFGNNSARNSVVNPLGDD